MKYKAVPLAHFHVEQVRLGKGKVMKKVSISTGVRFRQSGGSGLPYTKVKVRRDSNWKLIRGTKAWQAFLQHTKGHIYHRNQQATWQNKVRLPYHPLYGLSISQMARSKVVQTSALNLGVVHSVQKRFAESLKEVMA